jgi:hypothetical protein
VFSQLQVLASRTWTHLQSSSKNCFKIQRLVYMRSEIKIKVIAGHTVATIISWYAIDSGLVKFGTTPGGGGHAPTISAVEFMVRVKRREGA